MANVKTKIAVSALIVVVLVAAGAAVYKYETRVVPAPGVTVQQALQGQHNAEHKLAIAEAVNQHNEASLNQTISTLTGQKTALCNQIKAAHLVNAACVQ